MSDKVMAEAKRVEVRFNRITEADMIDYLEKTPGANASIMKRALRQLMFHQPDTQANPPERAEKTKVYARDQEDNKRKKQILLSKIKPISSEDLAND